MKYYILNNDKNKTGVPVLLNAVLLKNLIPIQCYLWCIRGVVPIAMNEYILMNCIHIKKDRLYTFDYIRFWDGYVVSSEFLELIKSFSFRYNIVKT